MDEKHFSVLFVCWVWQIQKLKLSWVPTVGQSNRLICEAANHHYCIPSGNFPPTSTKATITLFLVRFPASLALPGNLTTVFTTIIMFTWSKAPLANLLISWVLPHLESPTTTTDNPDILSQFVLRFILLKVQLREFTNVTVKKDCQSGAFYQRLI